MALVPIIFILALITLIWLAGLPILGAPAAVVMTCLLAGVGIGLLRLLRGDNMAHG